jgi:hypothetical protein
VQIEGNNAMADDAVMLDKDGYVSETNATNIVSFSCCLPVSSSFFFFFYPCSFPFALWSGPQS